MLSGFELGTDTTTLKLKLKRLARSAIIFSLSSILFVSFVCVPLLASPGRPLRPVSVFAFALVCASMHPPLWYFPCRCIAFSICRAGRLESSLAAWQPGSRVVRVLRI